MLVVMYKRIETRIMKTRRLEARNGCHVRVTVMVMRTLSKLVVYDPVWWDHRAWGRSRVMRRWGRRACVVVTAQRGWSLGHAIDGRVLYRIPHPRRWYIRHLLPRPPRLAPTTRPPRWVSEVLIGVVRFAERAVGLAGACRAFQIVYRDQRPIGVVNGASFLISGRAPRGRR